MQSLTKTHTAKKTAAAPVYQLCLSEALRLASGMVGVLVDAAVQSMRALAEQASEPNTRTRLHDAADLLVRHRATLLELVPEHLSKALSAAARGGAAANMKPALVRFDQLELMDDLQVQENVELARALQNTTRVCEAALSELDARICAAQGLASVRADSNPLRPQTFNLALRDAFAALQVSPTSRLLWMQHMTQSLGQELQKIYLALVKLLKEHHVEQAAYAVSVNPASASALSPAPATSSFEHSSQPRQDGQNYQPAGQQAQGTRQPAGQGSAVHGNQMRGHGAQGNGAHANDAQGNGAQANDAQANDAHANAVQPELLAGFSPEDVNRLGITLEQLRDLLAGNAMGDVAAALSALQAPELHGVIPSGHATHNPNADPQFAHTAPPEQGSSPSEPAVAQEVVRMMVENILQDERLLSPVREAVGVLGSALIALALHDPRYINDKTHPAMVLLNEITVRSLAFASVQAPGFHTFFDPVMLAVQNLSMQEIRDESPFEAAWLDIAQAWAVLQAQVQVTRDQAVQALLRVEQRNLLADKISFELTSRDDARDAPIFLKKFLIGPWAQVLAGIRLQEGNAQNDSHGYSGAVADLLWTCQIEQARKNRPRLVRSIPRLLSKLREGLASIHCPDEQSKAFFVELMLWHERALKPPSQQEIAASLAAMQAAANAALTAPPTAQPSAAAKRQDLLAMMQEADNDQAWLAPQEVRDSGFMDSNSLGGFAPTQTQNFTPQTAANAVETASAYAAQAAPYLARMQLGCWVEFQSDQQWLRAQLTWASPHSTLYMFTGAGHKPHSMTRRALEKMVVKNMLRMVANEGVVASALDAVAQTAVRNTVNRAP